MFSNSSSSNNTGSTFSSGKCTATLIPENRRKSRVLINMTEKELILVMILVIILSPLWKIYISPDVYDGRKGEYGTLKRYSRRIGIH